MTLAALIAWLLRLPLASRFLSAANEIARAIANDLFLVKPCCVHTRQDVDGALRHAHAILHAAILLRACELAGLKAPRLAVGKAYRVAWVSSHATLCRRFGEFLRRLARFELLARRLAGKLLDACFGVVSAGAPSGVPANPRAAPAPKRGRRTPFAGHAPRDGPFAAIPAI